MNLIINLIINLALNLIVLFEKLNYRVDMFFRRCDGRGG